MDLNMDEQPNQIDKTVIDNLAAAVEKNMDQMLNNQYQYIIDSSQKNKLTDSPHEIMFEVTAYVMEENNKGESIGTKEISTKQYHVPVPIGKDYNMFMGIFFKHIEDCLLYSIDKASDTTETSTNE